MTTRTATTFAVGPYRLDAARHYDAEHHLWIQPVAEARVRVGFDPLGAETAGDVVAVALEPVGSRVERGAAYGSLEAAKFVGPLVAPVGGTIAAHNPAVLASPALLNADPMAHWLVEIDLDADLDDASGLLSGEEAVRDWFATEIKRFKQKGMIAE